MSGEFVAEDKVKYNEDRDKLSNGLQDVLSKLSKKATSSGQSYWLTK